MFIPRIVSPSSLSGHCPHLLSGMNHQICSRLQHHYKDCGCKPLKKHEKITLHVYSIQVHGHDTSFAKLEGNGTVQDFPVKKLQSFLSVLANHNIFLQQQSPKKRFWLDQTVEFSCSVILVFPSPKSVWKVTQVYSQKEILPLVHTGRFHALDTILSCRYPLQKAIWSSSGVWCSLIIWWDCRTPSRHPVSGVVFLSSGTR